MSISNGTVGNDPSDAIVGRLLSELAEEWLRLERNQNTSTHARGLLRDVFGALALQLGVRATESRAGGTPPEMLAQYLKGYRSEFAETVSSIAK